MAAKLTRLTYKIAIQLHLVAESIAVLVPGGQSGNFWLHPRISMLQAGFEIAIPVFIRRKTVRALHSAVNVTGIDSGFMN
jgi:hypothetical protein